jgi:hypothetical protein
VPEPAGDVAHLFPPQRAWNEQEDLGFPDSRLSEFDPGRLEVLDRPGEFHQSLVVFLYEVFTAHGCSAQLGWVVAASTPVKLWQGKLREPGGKVSLRSVLLGLSRWFRRESS